MELGLSLGNGNGNGNAPKPFFRDDHPPSSSAPLHLPFSPGLHHPTKKCAGEPSFRILRWSENKGDGGCSDEEEENGMGRKKLRLSKEQSAFLEQSFKEHSTLNPKQKMGLAKQLNLRPRQVEVWFQNRRARTKVKQTEVDCECLKRWCERLREENRRLQKEVQELRALKPSASHPFYNMPTLTMCPSCQITTTLHH